VDFESRVSPLCDGVAFTNVVLRLAVHHGPRKSPWGKRGVISPKAVSGQLPQFNTSRYIGKRCATRQDLLLRTPGGDRPFFRLES
jgi:hypothetical protein